MLSRTSSQWVPLPVSLAAVALLVMLCGGAADPGLLAQSGGDAQDLGKKLSNPVSDIVSVPFQFNWENGVGEQDATRFILNLQPVVPFKLSENWNVIGRFILPFVSQPALVPGGAATSGPGDIITSAFFSPAKATTLVWGVGPVLGLPTSSDPFLGTGKWMGGPTAVVLKLSGPWVYGGLANHLWSYADTSDVEREDVSSTFLQPFLSYVTGKGVTYSLSSESTLNWRADQERWTVPINAGVSRLSKFGPYPFQMGIGGGYYVQSPEGGPDWKIKITFTLILPQGK